MTTVCSPVPPSLRQAIFSDRHFGWFLSAMLTRHDLMKSNSDLGLTLRGISALMQCGYSLNEIETPADARKINRALALLEHAHALSTLHARVDVTLTTLFELPIEQDELNSQLQWLNNHGLIQLYHNPSAIAVTDAGYYLLNAFHFWSPCYMQ